MDCVWLIRDNLPFNDFNSWSFKWRKFISFKHFFFLFFDFKNEFLKKKDIGICSNKIFRNQLLRSQRAKWETYRRFFWLNKPFRSVTPRYSMRLHFLYHKTALFSFFNSFHAYSLRSLYLVYDCSYSFYTNVIKLLLTLFEIKD